MNGKNAEVTVLAAIVILVAASSPALQAEQDDRKSARGGTGQLETVESPYIPIKGCAYRLALADVNGDGRNEMIYGSYDGAVRCQDLNSGNLLWEASTN